MKSCPNEFYSPPKRGIWTILFSLSDVYFENIIAMAACNLQLESKEHQVWDRYNGFGCCGKTGCFLICRFCLWNTGNFTGTCYSLLWQMIETVALHWRKWEFKFKSPLEDLVLKQGTQILTLKQMLGNNPPRLLFDFSILFF